MPQKIHENEQRTLNHVSRTNRKKNMTSHAFANQTNYIYQHGPQINGNVPTMSANSKSDSTIEIPAFLHLFRGKIQTYKKKMSEKFHERPGRRCMTTFTDLVRGPPPKPNQNLGIR